MFGSVGLRQWAAGDLESHFASKSEVPGHALDQDDSTLERYRRGKFSKIVEYLETEKKSPDPTSRDRYGDAIFPRSRAS